jgi:hypothetical protein
MELRWKRDLCIFELFNKTKLEKRKILNGLPNSLTQSYFSTIFYYEKGYMVDWIWNAAIENNITELTIDILNETVEPKVIQIKPIIVHLPTLKETIEKTLKNENFELNFIKDGKLYIKIFEKENRLRCVAILTDQENKKYIGNEYFEHPYDNNFKVFNSRSKNDMDWANEADNSLNTSEWFGAIIRYLGFFGKRKFNTFYNQKVLWKNAVIGNIFQIILLLSFFYFLYRYLQPD